MDGDIKTEESEDRSRDEEKTSKQETPACAQQGDEYQTSWRHFRCEDTSN